MKEEGKEHREQELLDLYPNKLTEEQLNDERQKKKILRMIRKAQQRKYAFKHITKHIGRGIKKSLVRMYEVDENQKIKQTHIGKEAIEQALMNHNRKYFTMAHESNMYNDKIYPLLQQDHIRDKILKGRLVEDDCDNNEVLEFL